MLAGQLMKSKSNCNELCLVRQCLKALRTCQSVLIDPIRVQIGQRGAATDTIEQKLIFVGREEGKLVAMRQLIQEGGMTPPVIIFVQSRERAAAVQRISL